MNAPVRQAFVALDLGTARTRSLSAGGFAIADRPSAVPAHPRRPTAHAHGRSTAPDQGWATAPDREEGVAPGRGRSAAPDRARTPDPDRGWTPAPGAHGGATMPGDLGEVATLGHRGRAGAPGDPGRTATPGPGLVRPLRHGMVADPGACHRLVRLVLHDARLSGAWPLDRVLAGVPVAATASDRAAVRTAVSEAAECAVTLVEEPLAAAVGAGLDVTGSRPVLLLDVGAGIVEAVVIRDGVVTDALALQLSATTRTGLPSYALDGVVEMTARLLRRLPARLRPAARDGGLFLTGGGALQPGLTHRLRETLRLPVEVAPDPAHATVRGLTRLCLRPALAGGLAAGR
ncbi:rod shape-determining protein [Nonomuraea roseoviolacea]|uniref:Actin-like ATPase involved in cell morphogenesis n=1 Tax=Nonomuraea roseoviolacea subsp. carminata TaxID=160689 RepID=A0ABT1KFD6_9ACTN|nr:rod shape-determining protein [Nonomuraea roseoviolacea]MCP2352071.1 actin-like ATPase involved in cell morphogenesis [Nonomuraea roseoviolacea subsp. carminata]